MNEREICGIKVICGPRGSGKNLQAIEEAKKTGRRLVVIAPDEEYAKEVSRQYDVRAISVRKAQPGDWRLGSDGVPCHSADDAR